MCASVHLEQVPACAVTVPMCGERALVEWGRGFFMCSKVGLNPKHSFYLPQLGSLPKKSVSKYHLNTASSSGMVSAHATNVPGYFQYLS